MPQWWRWRSNGRRDCLRRGCRRVFPTPCQRGAVAGMRSACVDFVCANCRELVRDHRTDSFRVLMFPNSDHSPTQGAQVVRRFEVTMPIRLDLVQPESRIRLWRNEVVRTAMPEASIHEDGQSFGPEYDVDSSPRHPGNWSLQPEAKTASVESRTDAHFSRRAMNLLALHTLSHAIVFRRRPRHVRKPFRILSG